MNRLRWLFSGLALALPLALVAGAFAVTGGGFPSFPQFQAVGIGTPAPAAGNLAVTGNYTSTGGNVTLTNGNVTLTNGSLTLSNGNLSAGVGELVVTSANTTAQSLTVVGPLSAGTSSIGSSESVGSSFQVGGGTTINTTTGLAFYTDSGKNFSGATPPTVGGSAICVASGTNCPASGKAPIICTAGGACSVTGMVVGQTATAVKNGNTSRNTTTIPTADPDLQFSNVPTGLYSVQLHVVFNESTTNTQGFQWYLKQPTNGGAQVGTCVISGTSAATAQTLALGEFQNTSYTQAVTAGANVTMECTGMLSGSGGPGTMSFNWAQAVSSGNNTSVGNVNTATTTSFFVITKLS